MRQEGGWSEATIRDRRARADDFLRRFCGRTGALAEVTIATIDQALNENNARTGRPRCCTTIRTHADALRAFFRFAEDCGWSRSGVSARVQQLQAATGRASTSGQKRSTDFRWLTVNGMRCGRLPTRRRLELHAIGAVLTMDLPRCVDSWLIFRLPEMSVVQILRIEL